MTPQSGAATKAVAEDMVQLELKLRVADSKYLLEELKKKDKQMQRLNLELLDQERVIKRLNATILKLGGNPDELVEVEDDVSGTFE